MLPPRDMNLEERDAYRRAFSQTLSLADDRAFLTMVWAVDALQNGRSEEALRHLYAVPAEDFTDRNAVRGWELETLANEVLSNLKNPHYRLFDTQRWESIANLVNVLRRLENAEYGARRGNVPILREMYRIGNRQFEWQRGFFDIPQFYRHTFIYGQGDSAEYFRATHGIDIADMGLMGFALLAAFSDQPIYDRRGDLGLIGIAPDVRERVLARLTAPVADMRALATQVRANGADTAYRPSVLRRYPLISAGHGRRMLHAPLPQLIAARVTSGLFYDVVDGGGPLRADYGHRFEGAVSLTRTRLHTMHVAL
ncbi:hypothetical protein [Sphingomonas sp. CROZ-RG-20F-R02-07]|uniref:hypothetical protein n=1 Tax=Sphingomonas sp. CROZ-RG-20F-R02-07 TaxID=2914832 RepID=UPI001F5A934F|nr:hypothetical protein [Sphingomonas sp. CROZ-RG-20F-R02-07]